MYLHNLTITNYGPIKNLSYSFRFDDNNNAVPLVIIGKNGCGKTLLFSHIVDMMVEAKKQLYPKGILEVTDSQFYYKTGNRSYINYESNTSLVEIEYGSTTKNIKYIDIMSRNPQQAITAREISAAEVIDDPYYNESGFYKDIDLCGTTTKEFESSIRLFFPFDRFYKPMWYNTHNYNRIPSTSSNSLGYSNTNLIKIDILENIREWFRTLHLQTRIQEIILPNHEGIPQELRGQTAKIRHDTDLQRHLKQILSIIKGDGSYLIRDPARNSTTIGIQGPSTHCNDISQLSAGELTLYALALAIIKEWDTVYNNDSLKLEDITGCVLIDEADANLHIDFAYRALPALMKLFPKIQFVLTTHSPFLLAGLKKEYGNNIDILSLPTGELIHDLNSFSEITTAYEVFNAEATNILQRFHTLSEEYERIKTLNNKIVLYTEGKTDIKYLQLALERLDGFDDIKSRIEYYDIEKAKKTGDGELDKIFDYLQKGSDSNIKICMFDRDNSNYIFSEPFVRGENKVYKFNLPTPSHRNDTDMISVEHCLTDDALKTVDANGRRIFLSGEFGSTGISTDNQYVCHHKMGTNPLEILDGANQKKVFKNRHDDPTNYALTKDDFVQHIIENDPGFDSFSFDGFRPTLEMIRQIIRDADGE